MPVRVKKTRPIKSGLMVFNRVEAAASTGGPAQYKPQPRPLRADGQIERTSNRVIARYDFETRR